MPWNVYIERRNYLGHPPLPGRTYATSHTPKGTSSARSALARVPRKPTRAMTPSAAPPSSVGVTCTSSSTTPTHCRPHGWSSSCPGFIVKTPPRASSPSHRSAWPKVGALATPIARSCLQPSSGRRVHRHRLQGSPPAVSWRYPGTRQARHTPSPHNAHQEPLGSIHRRATSSGNSAINKLDLP